MHPSNPHQGQYDFTKLCQITPALNDFTKRSPKGNITIDFSNDEAVKKLNEALLGLYYGVSSWDIPKNYLCPGVPGRADYIYHLNDLLGNPNSAKILDIGTGANAIYPIVGMSAFGWDFVATEIDELALSFAKKNCDDFGRKIEFRLQKVPSSIFAGVTVRGMRLMPLFVIHHFTGRRMRLFRVLKEKIQA